MRVLVACEYSGVVRDAFLAEGHDAISCDLLPTESPGPHIQGDVRPLLRERWDLVIAHPPCTYLSIMSQCRGYPPERIVGMIDGAGFFNECLAANAPMVAVENPTPSGMARKLIGLPDCIVQPHWFGDPYTKRTGLWLRGLPPLMPTLLVEPYTAWVMSGKKPGATNYQRKYRSKTFPGMAAAMAQQWG